MQIKILITFCKDFNIRICTTSVESPWSNGFIERHNTVVRLTVTKTITATSCDLGIAVAWALSAKNSMTNDNGFSPNPLVPSKNPDNPNKETILPPALENKTSSELILKELKSLHSARKNSIKAESPEKLKKDFQYNIKTHADVVYKQGDIVFYKRANNATWK